MHQLESLVCKCGLVALVDVINERIALTGPFLVLLHLFCR